jgi:predicted small metal-binding protein
VKSIVLNFNCIFSSCDYKRNDVEEDFLKHLKEEHNNEIIDISKKETIPIKMAEMIAVSNSKVFINS